MIKILLCFRLCRFRINMANCTMMACRAFTIKVITRLRPFYNWEGLDSSSGALASVIAALVCCTAEIVPARPVNT